MRETPRPQKLRSRAYPAIALPESLDLLRRLKSELGWGERDRDSIARALGYAGGHSGIAARKTAALVHFGLMRLSGGRYSPTALAREILEETDEARRRNLLRDAFLGPALFREIVLRYEAVGRVPRQLALTLSLDHGIQEHARDEVAQIFMRSAVYAGVLESDGSFRGSYFADTHRPQPLSESGAEGAAKEAPEAGRQHRFPVTDKKEVIFHLPAHLNERDIPLLRAQVDYLELQLKQDRPDQPVRFDVYHGDRKRSSS